MRSSWLSSTTIGHLDVSVRCAGQTGIMFLNEVALGQEYSITTDDWEITRAPEGYDSIVAKGHTEPGNEWDKLENFSNLSCGQVLNRRRRLPCKMVNSLAKAKKCYVVNAIA